MSSTRLRIGQPAVVVVVPPAPPRAGSNARHILLAAANLGSFRTLASGERKPPGPEVPDAPEAPGRAGRRLRDLHAVVGQARQVGLERSGVRTAVGSLPPEPTAVRQRRPARAERGLVLAREPGPTAATEESAAAATARGAARAGSTGCTARTAAPAAEAACGQGHTVCFKQAVNAELWKPRPPEGEVVVDGVRGRRSFGRSAAAGREGQNGDGEQRDGHHGDGEFAHDRYRTT